AKWSAPQIPASRAGAGHRHHLRFIPRDTLSNCTDCRPGHGFNSHRLDDGLGTSWNAAPCRKQCNRCPRGHLVLDRGSALAALQCRSRNIRAFVLDHLPQSHADEGQRISFPAAERRKSLATAEGRGLYGAFRLKSRAGVNKVPPTSTEAGVNIVLRTKKIA